METLIIVTIGLVVVAGVMWMRTSKHQGRPSSESSEKPTIDAYSQSVIESANRLVDVINESLKIANESQNADTKISRLDVAKQRLSELKRISREHSFINLTQLPQVEQSIADLESEFGQAQYREAAGGNMSGQSLEKEGKIDEAIVQYERLIEAGVDTPFTYRRLAIIYSKRKKREEELRVLRAAMENVPKGNSKHYQWFADRFAKKSSGK